MEDKDGEKESKTIIVLLRLLYLAFDNDGIDSDRKRQRGFDI